MSSLPGLASYLFLPTRIRLLVKLCKLPLSVAVAVSTAAGFVLKAGSLQPDISSPMVGVFLLACGCCAWNQITDRSSDSKMLRTASRPLPSGDIGLTDASIIAAILISGGLAILWSIGYPGCLLGLFALIWYNILYAFLKRSSAYAVIPGALVGALPPAIGWIAAGGHIADRAILSLCLFIFLWQIPHFWLLALMHADDYRRSGFPSLCTVLTPSQFGRFVFPWIVATGVAGSLLPLVGMGVRSLTIQFLLITCGVILVLLAYGLLLGNRTEPRPRAVFLTINLYALLICILTCIDRLA